MKGWLYLLLLMFAPAAFAGPFDPPSTDQSVSLLGIIFSGSVGSLYLGGGEANPVLTSLMEKFNFIIVVVGTVVVSYVAILSTINTAHEGTAMGKKWSAIWIPMRSVAGMALLVPAPSTGYSMIQVTVMWIVLQGIGAADSLWSIALEGLKNGVSASSGTKTSPTFYNQLESNAMANLSKQIMNMNICQKTLFQLSTAPNVTNGSFVQQYGQSISPYGFVIPNGNNPSASADQKPSSDGTTGNCYTYTGIFYMGVNDNVPTHMDVCGSIPITAQVCPSEYQTNPPPTADQLKADAQNMFDVKSAAISQMLTVVDSIAQGIATNQYTATNQPAAGALKLSADAYASAMAGLVVPNGAQYTNNQPANNTQAATQVATGNTPNITSNEAWVESAIEQGEANGWISAGSFYFIFNRTMVGTIFNSALHDSMPGSGTSPSCVQGSPCHNAIDSSGKPNGSAVPDSATDLNNATLADQQNIIAGNLAAGDAYMTNDKGSVSSQLNFTMPGSTPGGSSLAAAIDSFNSAGQAIMTEMSQLFNTIGCAGGSSITQTQGGVTAGVNVATGPDANCGTEDPLLAHSVFGRDIMLACEGVFTSVIASFVGIIVAMGFAIGLSFIPGFGAGLAYGTATLLFGILTIGLYILTLVFPLIAFLWSWGAILAIYCPLIPFMIFTMGALGWMLTVTEAIIAAPLIALGLVMPAGDEVGKLEHALMILANIFLRPLLMIFGFILAGGVYKAVVQLIDFGMGAVFQTIAVTTLFSFVVVIVVYVSFILSVTNVAFSLIYAVPDRILRWLGGPSETTDPGPLKEVKGAAQAAGSKVGGDMQAVSEKVGGAGKAAGKDATLTAAKGTGSGLKGSWGRGHASGMAGALGRALSGQSGQGSSRSGSQGGNQGNQGDNQGNQGGTQGNQGGTQGNQGGTQGNQGGTQGTHGDGGSDSGSET